MLMAVNSTIKNIIFDLGGVVLDIDIPRTTRAFASLSETNEEDILANFKTSELFNKFETGEVDVAGFRDLIRRVVGRPLEDAVIDLAWNALLLDIPPARIDLIFRLRRKYRVFLLSNTSSIHIEEVNHILKRNHQLDGLDALFERAFLSYEMGVMKPDPEIYLKTLSAAGILAEETLFLDDNEENIKAASVLGIHSILVRKPLTILDYLKEYAD